MNVHSVHINNITVYTFSEDSYSNLSSMDKTIYPNIKIIKFTDLAFDHSMLHIMQYVMYLQ